MNQRICPRRDNSGYGIVARARARRLSTGRSRLESEIFSADGSWSEPSIDVYNSDGDSLRGDADRGFNAVTTTRGR